MKVDRVNAYMVTLGGQSWYVLPDGSVHRARSEPSRIKKRRAVRLALDAADNMDRERVQGAEFAKEIEWRDSCKAMASNVNMKEAGYQAMAKEPWLKACQTFAIAARYRDKAWKKRGPTDRRRHEPQDHATWEESCRAMEKSAYCRERWHLPGREWERWAVNKASNNQKRHDIIGARRDELPKPTRESRPRHRFEIADADPEPRVQVCFEWG